MSLSAHARVRVYVFVTCTNSLYVSDGSCATEIVVFQTSPVTQMILLFPSDPMDLDVRYTLLIAAALVPAL